MNPKDQIPSSLNNELLSNYIKFLLSVSRKNQKIIHASINNILYNYVIARCVQLNCSISEYIKRLIIKDLLESGIIKLENIQNDNEFIQYTIQNMIQVRVKQKRESEFIDKKTKRVLIQKLNGRKIKREITEIKRELNSLYDEVRRYHREKMKYRYIVPPQYNALSNRLEILRERVLQLLKQNIPAHFIDDLNEIIDKINDIEELLET